MRTTRKTVARLLPLLALLALLPFGTWSCEDAGDEPDGPTGPSSIYNPEIDAQGASIKVSVKGSAGPGGEFDLIAKYLDGDGRPVQGVALTAQAETGTGNVVKYFTFDSNPTTTSAGGTASIHVNVSADCPVGSYQFVVSSSPGGGGPVNGAYAKGYARVVISGAGTTAVTGITLTTSTPSIATGENASFTVTATLINCDTVNMTYDAVGPSLSVTDSPILGSGLTRVFSVGPIMSAGNLSVVAKAWCSAPETTSVLTSAPASVSVSTPSP